MQKSNLTTFYLSEFLQKTYPKTYQPGEVHRIIGQVAIESKQGRHATDDSIASSFIDRLNSFNMWCSRRLGPCKLIDRIVMNNRLAKNRSKSALCDVVNREARVFSGVFLASCDSDLVDLIL